MRSMLRARTITQWPQARLYSSTDTGIRGSGALVFEVLLTCSNNGSLTPEIRDELHRGVKAALKVSAHFSECTYFSKQLQ